MRASTERNGASTRCRAVVSSSITRWAATGSAWHRAGSGGFLRNVVYGFNDGLTANFGLVAGVVQIAPDDAAVATIHIGQTCVFVLDQQTRGRAAARRKHQQ